MIVLSAWAIAAHADYDAVSARGRDLSGRWILNGELSDDAEAMLARQIEKERSRDARWRRQVEQARRPDALPPLDADQASAQGSNTSRRTASQRSRQQQRDENFRRMLVITQVLEIRQSGAQLEFAAESGTRRFAAGTRSQVSMPQGQLADSRVGWDGDWFVIDRRVSKGPRVNEKFRLLPTGQLEYRMTWRGDTELAGMKVRRIFDRAPDEAVLPSQAGPSGQVRRSLPAAAAPDR